MNTYRINQKITEQESPWDLNAVDPNSYTVKGLKFKYLYDELEKCSSGDLLEIGCGHGKILYSLYSLNKDINYFGNEKDKEAVEFCRRNFQFAHIFDGDYKDIPENRKYDFIILFDILEHVKNYKKLLEKCSRIIKDDGKIFMLIMAEGGFGIYSFLRFFKKDWSKITRGHVHYYSKKKILSEISTNFIYLKKKYLYHFWGSIFDAIFFFVTLNPIIKKNFWQNYQSKKKITFSYCFSKYIEFLFYIESYVLQNISISASALFVVVQKKP